MSHPCEPSYERLLQIREELQAEENVDVRKLKAISIQIARNEQEL
jgi:hypothetical protein